MGVGRGHPLQVYNSFSFESQKLSPQLFKLLRWVGYWPHLREGGHRLEPRPSFFLPSLWIKLTEEQGLAFLTCSSPFLTQPYQPWVATSPPPFPGTITALLGDAMNVDVGDPCPACTSRSQTKSTSGPKPALQPSGNCSSRILAGLCFLWWEQRAAKRKPCELPSNINHLYLPFSSVLILHIPNEGLATACSEYLFINCTNSSLRKVYFFKWTLICLRQFHYVVLTGL